MPALFLAFSSCNKPSDGVYHPNKKISKIYDESMSFSANGDTAISKYVLETWVWENDNLASIAFGDDTYISIEDLPAVHFYYSDGKLSKIVSEDNTIFTFSYKGNKFDKIEVKNSDEELSGSFKFKHRNGKITEVSYEGSSLFSYVKKSNEFMHRILGLFMPVQTSQMLSNIEKSVLQKLQSKESTGITIKNVMELDWDGKNVEKVTSTYSTGDYWASHEEKIVEKYSYDNKHNPYANYFNGPFQVMYASENNIVKIERNYGYGHVFSSKTYEYDSDDYPIRQVNDYSYGPEIQRYGILIEYK
jgi:hypothetical protein